MTALFKCHNCGVLFGQDVELYGLLFDNCPNCGSVFADCTNKEECLEFIRKKNNSDKNFSQNT